MKKDQAQKEKPANWYLEGALGPSKAVVISIDSFPFRIGRQSDCDLAIASNEVSREHATISIKGDALSICDHNSTNYTFVNRQKIEQPTAIYNGDVLHFGALEFRLKKEATVLEPIKTEEDLGITTMRKIVNPDQELPMQFVDCENEFMELLESRLLKTQLQPILRFDDESIIAYEVLGRGQHKDLPEAPEQLFAIAERLGHAEHLSQIFRQVGVESSLALDNNPIIFLNTHPAELFKKDLIVSLEKLRDAAPNMPLVLEIHESAITLIDKLRIFVETLKDLEIKLSYDDFGAGQTRLNELVEVPPDFLKFDISLIKNIHQASSKKQSLVRALVEISNDLGIAALAEGVELPEEAEVCKLMGFSHVQGYLYGKPAAVESFTMR